MAYPVHPAWKRGTQWLNAGGIFGAVGGLVVFALPLLFVALAKYNPGGFFVFASSPIQFTGPSLLAGSALTLVSLFCYRWAYSVLRRARPGYWGASVLCLIGSSGLILIAVAAAVVFGGAASIEACVQGSYSSALSCVESASPVGAYAGVLGFWLGWVGAVGIAIGLFLASSSFRSAAYLAGGVLYAILLAVLVGPFAGLVHPLPDIPYLLAAVPVLAILAPILVAVARPTLPAPGVVPGPEPSTAPPA